MKKIVDMLRPFLSIIFGVLILLCYLNYLSFQGSALAVGIIAVILSAFYICTGVIAFLLGDKIGAKVRGILDVCTISLYPLFYFVIYLISMINVASTLGPNGYVIHLVSMIVSIMFAMLYLLAKLLNVKELNKPASLFGFAFIGALVLNLVFNPYGFSNALGDIGVVELVIYACFSSMLLSALGGLNSANEQPQEPVQEEASEQPVEEPQE